MLRPDTPSAAAAPPPSAAPDPKACLAAINGCLRTSPAAQRSLAAFQTALYKQKRPANSRSVVLGILLHRLYGISAERTAALSGLGVGRSTVGGWVRQLKRGEAGEAAQLLRALCSELGHS
eukprot:TRINITY_DN10651_c0_g1_i8.p2 TRINITY_DN10651_c0_g1~~TRINITY_DN10651_c0_g1_i8.p2  ORF type:complete len:121 (+),score=35.18 TRINITY_DN10651_c0_g1_i8:509-871(+)